VIFNTGAAQKYVEVLEGEMAGVPRLEGRGVDWSVLQSQ